MTDPGIGRPPSENQPYVPSAQNAWGQIRWTFNRKLPNAIANTAAWRRVARRRIAKARRLR